VQSDDTRRTTALGECSCQIGGESGVELSRGASGRCGSDRHGRKAALWGHRGELSRCYLGSSFSSSADSKGTRSTLHVHEESERASVKRSKAVVRAGFSTGGCIVPRYRMRAGCSGSKETRSETPPRFASTAMSIRVCSDGSWADLKPAFLCAVRVWKRPPLA
jgi:hypothetical protein